MENKQKASADREEQSGQGGTGALLLSLSALFLSVTSFRLTVLTQADRLANPTLPLTFTNQQLTSQLQAVTEMMQTFLQQSNQQQVGQPEMKHTDNIKIVHQHPVFRRAKSPQLNLAALESVLAELFGLPCPAPGRIALASPYGKPHSSDRETAIIAAPLVDNGLCVSQLLAVEPVMLLCSYDTVSHPQSESQKQTLLDSQAAVDAVLSLLLSGASPPTTSAPQSSMLMLQMRDIIERDLWKDEEDTGGNKEFRGSTTPVRNIRDSHRNISSPLADSRKTDSNDSAQSRNQFSATTTLNVTDNRNSSDIIDAAKRYLVALNSSMAERNKVLRRLVTLWQRSKRILEEEEEVYKDKKVGERRTMTLPKQPVASLLPRPDDDHNKKYRISSVQEVLLREVEAIQRSLLETDTQQQQQKIRFSTAMAFQSHDNLTAVPVFGEISLLEQGLRQGSADATKLISKLFSRLDSFNY